MKILVVDDQRSARRVLRQMLQNLDDTEVIEAASVDEALAVFRSSSPDMLLLDVRLSTDVRDRGGIEILKQLRATGSAVPVVMVTSASELSDVREAMRQGAQDYVLKDELAPEMLLPIVEALRDRMALRGEVLRLQRKVDKRWGLGALVGSSAPMERLRQLIRRVADADAAVLVRGETGTGKELVARALHEEGRRRNEPFVAVNCAALPSSLIESLLFGHEKGSFTGAARRIPGQLEQAGKGTLFLDEIGEMAPEMQAKLLRVLEERRVRPIGAEADLPFQARVVAATNAPLERRIAEGRFREDLLHRLNVVALDVPALADRPEDIPELLAAFSEGLSPRLQFTEDAVRWLIRRRWSGNVRELRNTVERLALLSPSECITVPVLEEFAPDRTSVDAANEIDHLARAVLSLPDRLGSKLRAVERAVLHHAIESCQGNKSAAARLIGVNRKALERRWDRINDEQEPD